MGLTVLGLVSSATNARADAPPRITKGPYLQALGATAVEIRVELDAPAPAIVTLSEGGDAGAPRVVRDDAATTMHVVRVDHLRPATRYAYAVSLGAPADRNGAGAAIGELTTAPPDDSRAPFSFLIYGDNRTDDVSHAAIVRAMLATPSDFLLNTGDLVQTGQSDANWQAFFDVEGPLLRSRSLFSCIGNHELTDGAGVNYLRYFGPTTDAHGPTDKPRLYGSFRWEDARFFLLDAMETFEAGSPERTWLEGELARADGEAGLVWRIAVMHHSPWSSGPHGSNARALQAGIPALLSAHKIDLVLAGHDHIYERGTASGLRYLISGGGGAPLYAIEHRLPSARKAESVHHVVEATIDGDTARFVARRDDGTIVDQCGITKGHEGWDCDPALVSASPSDAPPSSPPPRASHFGCAATAAGAGGSRDALAFLGIAALFASCARAGRARGRAHRD